MTVIIELKRNEKRVMVSDVYSIEEKTSKDGEKYIVFNYKSRKPEFSTMDFTTCDEPNIGFPEDEIKMFSVGDETKFKMEF